ncbi:hypothetical protein OG698_26515 [Streptomyces sp. NBC_01003]|uniref:hypothetical protein n=1 Tax=Streptomyces sp. NBC_01003 TaxID=2903714 RepID=UPI0038685575|nr:hypothetical protein OG698_26515 [Streptomyces sp. NBC_01003]
MLRRGLKLTAVAAVVVLALTGFSTGRGHGSGKSRGHSSSSSSGGGCSSSKQNHGGGYNGSHHSDYDDDDYDDDSYGSSGGSDTTPTPTSTAANTGDATFVIVDCAGPDRRAGKRSRASRKADSTVSVRVTSLKASTYDFGISVELLDARGNLVENVDESVTLDAGETKTVTLRMTVPSKASKVSKCANPWATTV